MDPSLYIAAMEGNIDVLLQNADQLEAQTTATGNTVLHVTAQFHDNAETVRAILNSHPSLLCRENSRGETALHIAARKGRTSTVQALIAFAKTLGEDPESKVRITREMLRMTTTEEKETALHEAVRNKNNLDVVEMLINEDPEFPHAPNTSGETPLYIASERDYCDVVSEILSTCTSSTLAYGGPNGRTALHAATLPGCSDCLRKLVAWNPNLTKEADSYGWTPLHCAARNNLVLTSRQLLNEDKFAAYLTTADNDDKKTALHLAATWGHVKVVEEILTHCPDCWEMVNGRGQNVLHIAVEREKIDVIKFILKQGWLDNLLNQKDMNGNTPLHLLAASNCNVPALIRHPVGDKGAFNKKNSTPQDIATSTDWYRLNEV